LNPWDVVIVVYIGALVIAALVLVVVALRH
jgi:hypothetical protein